MLQSNSFVKVQGLWNQICIKLVEFLSEKSSEILWKLIRLLKTGSESISKSGDIWNVMVLTQLWLILNTLFQVNVIVK